MEPFLVHLSIKCFLGDDAFSRPLQTVEFTKAVGAFGSSSFWSTGIRHIRQILMDFVCNFEKIDTIESNVTDTKD